MIFIFFFHIILFSHKFFDKGLQLTKMVRPGIFLCWTAAAARECGRVVSEWVCCIFYVISRREKLEFITQDITSILWWISPPNQNSVIVGETYIWDWPTQKSREEKRNRKGWMGGEERRIDGWMVKPSGYIRTYKCDVWRVYVVILIWDMKMISFYFFLYIIPRWYDI